MGFFPKKIGSSLSLCCLLSWTGEDLGAGAELRAKCSCLIMEFRLGNKDLVRAEGLVGPDIPALLFK